ncbi:MAG: FadR/GntR family transcriptional regulator [Thermomicrobiales bacterium]
MARQLRRETLSGQLAEELLSLIQREQLSPGDFLPSAAILAQDYGVSRPVVREALRTLEARNIIRTENGRGAIVQPISSELLSQYFRRVATVHDEALVELLEVRRGLEIESASLAAVRATEEELVKITSIVDEMRKFVGKGEGYAALDADLHLAIASATHNTMLYYLIESIREPLKESMEVGLRNIAQGLRSHGDVNHYRRVQELHEDLLRALQRHDRDEAATVMARHFDEAVWYIAGLGDPLAHGGGANLEMGEGQSESNLGLGSTGSSWP